MRSWCVAVMLFGLMSACTEVSAPGNRPQATPAPKPSPSPESTETPQESAGRFAPEPDRRIGARPARIAVELTLVTRALRWTIDRWVADRPKPRRPPEEVVLQALYQQRIYRRLSAAPRLAERVIARLERPLAREARANVTAGRLLASLIRPVEPPVTFKTQRPQPPGVLLRFYRKAERRFGVAWEVLAAINSVETRFGRIRSPSYAGAQGPMQFIPSTWAAYGMEGDVHDPHDAIMGAANYLSASGAPSDYRAALFAYNRADAYVDAILLYAQRIMADPRNYYGYYNWQVFVRTTNGDLRLTGPGLEDGDV
ncbi:MAG: lytic murein transglycosylase [Actinomycetota bacterium]